MVDITTSGRGVESLQQYIKGNKLELVFFIHQNWPVTHTIDNTGHGGELHGQPIQPLIRKILKLPPLEPWVAALIFEISSCGSPQVMAV